LTDSAKDIIAERGYDEKFGARPLKRSIQKYLEDPLAEEIIGGNVRPGDTIMVDYNKEEDRITMKAEKGKAPKKEEKKADGGTPPTEDSEK